MNDLSKQHGAFSWSELMTTDTLAAKQFYSRLFGWEVEDIAMPNMTYTVVSVSGRGVGGIMPIPPHKVSDGDPQTQSSPPHWGSYVTVDDVDASAKLAEELGAKILVSPTDIQDVGRFCVFKDPQGAVLSIISYTS